MARVTHLIHEVIVNAFSVGAETETTRDLRAAFTEVLIPDLNGSDFADMFSQTIAYGLFAARAPCWRSTLPASGCSGGDSQDEPVPAQIVHDDHRTDLDEEPFAGLVDDLAQLLAQTDIEDSPRGFRHADEAGRSGSPFYETFLAAYDPELREMRGVYYTPEPVVSYIVHSTDHLLRERFGAELAWPTARRDLRAHERRGNAELETVPRVLILDPACGTGTFLYAVVNLIRDQFITRNDAGRWSGYVRDQFLPRLFGFELLMAPYAVAHLKLGMQPAAQDLPETQRVDWTYDFASGERLGVYLTNTLEQMVRRSELLLGRISRMRLISRPEDQARPADLRCPWESALLGTVRKVALGEKRSTRGTRAGSAVSARGSANG